jgi:hypothetical protein
MPARDSAQQAVCGCHDDEMVAGSWVSANEGKHVQEPVTVGRGVATLTAKGKIGRRDQSHGNTKVPNDLHDLASVSNQILAPFRVFSVRRCRLYRRGRLQLDLWVQEEVGVRHCAQPRLSS